LANLGAGTSKKIWPIHVELTVADLQGINAELAMITVHGGRMSAKYMVEVEE
jgi:hypothetical protein